MKSILCDFLSTCHLSSSLLKYVFYRLQSAGHEKYFVIEIFQAGTLKYQRYDPHGFLIREDLFTLRREVVQNLINLIRRYKLWLPEWLSKYRVDPIGAMHQSVCFLQMGGTEPVCVFDMDIIEAQDAPKHASPCDLQLYHMFFDLSNVLLQDNFLLNVGSFARMKMSVIHAEPDVERDDICE